MSKAKNDLDKILARLSSSVKDVVKQTALNRVGKFTLELVVKRTRLGYGVRENFGQKEKLAKLSKQYVKARSVFDGLNDLTSPKKSNLTRTGEMLDSMRYKVYRDGTINIGPTGTRNINLASYHAAGNSKLPRRIFNRVSQLEFNQVLRFYRKNIGDLLRLRKLIK